MKQYELSKPDFEALDLALKIAIDECDKSNTQCGRLEKLKDLFAKANTANLQIESE